MTAPRTHVVLAGTWVLILRVVRFRVQGLGFGV